MPVRREVIKITRDYVRRGGKGNRRKQLSRMVAFADFCEASSPGIALAQVGGRHVIGYYRSILHLNQTTREAHYYAIATLFKLACKPAPPRPYTKRGD